MPSPYFVDLDSASIPGSTGTPQDPFGTAEWWDRVYYDGSGSYDDEYYLKGKGTISGGAFAAELTKFKKLAPWNEAVWGLQNITTAIRIIGAWGSGPRPEIYGGIFFTPDSIAVHGGCSVVNCHLDCSTLGVFNKDPADNDYYFSYCTINAPSGFSPYTSAGAQLRFHYCLMNLGILYSFPVNLEIYQCKTNKLFTDFDTAYDTITGSGTTYGFSFGAFSWPTFTSPLSAFILDGSIGFGHVTAYAGVPWFIGPNGIATAEAFGLVVLPRFSVDIPLQVPISQRGSALPDRQGWWADNEMGSKLWLLRREKTLPEILSRAEQYARESLQWMITDGLALRIDITAERYDMQSLLLKISITKPTGNPLFYAYYYNWQYQIFRRI